MAESFAGGESLVVCLGDNIFELAEAAAVAWADGPDGALIFVKEVPDPERFGVVVYGEDGGVTDVVEKAGVVDTRYGRRRPATRSSASTATRRTSSGSSAASRRPHAGAGDHGREPRVRRAGAPALGAGRRLVARCGDARGAGHDRQPHRRDGREPAGVIPGVLLLPLRVFSPTSAAGSARCVARLSSRTRPSRPTSRSRARA